ncbi:ABC transporter substrate-binding protein [Labrenzia sp. PHM005]|uniref:ABC transporter substrate-binding protein n=1 Tax=Labrenzia sp. PHM005 TaxID=2590016 RepID=UPI00114092BC|nr:ABC transporter substrate-binding protein [Labrenzia sp. PHM005]QDG76328.1 peptide ABC transporter substrate-binding protein [Labrenzia sp. PHM005]
MSVTILQARTPLGDPHDCTDAADELSVLGAIYDTLVRREGAKFVPGLAECWQVSGGGRIWRFFLRSGVTFHDGTECDAAAVQASLERMAREDKGYTLGSPAVWRQYLEGAVYAASGLALTVTLAEPMADFCDVLIQAFIVAPSAFEALDAGDQSAHCGSGPFRLAGRSEDTLVLEASGVRHWPKPKNTSLRIAREPDADKRLAAVAAGEALMAAAIPPHAERHGVALHTYRAPVAIIYLLNAEDGPLRDPRVRKALSLAVDRDAVVQGVLGGAGEPLHGFVSPAHFGADAAQRVPHDPDTARQLLCDAGYKDGLELAVDCPTRLPDEAQILTDVLAEQLANVGIRLSVHIHEDREAYAHMVRRKEIRDLCVFDSSPMSTFRVLYEKIDSRIAGAWWQGYRNTAVEALIDRGRETENSAEREAIFREAYRLLQQDPAWLTLYNPLRAVAFFRDIKGFSMPVDGVPDLRALPDLTGAAHG